MTYLPHKYRPIWFKATHALVVGLVLLGAVRSLVPGLCATMAAAVELGQARSEAKVAACCAARMAAEAEAPAWRAPNAAKAHPPCAFCHLVLGLGHSTPVPPVVVALVPCAPCAFEAPATVATLILPGARTSRAPPAFA